MEKSLKPFLLIHLLFLTLFSPLHAMSTEDNPIQDDEDSFRFVHAHKKHAPHKKETIVTSQRPALVLSLDGGGMRGLATAEILQHMENNLSEKLQTKVTLNDSFDLFAGTSTGGLMSLMLASGHPIDECVTLYKVQGPEIFKTSYYNNLTGLWGYWGPRYDVSTGLYPLLEKVIGNTPLKEAKKPVFVTTYAYEKNRLLLLDSEHAKKSTKGYHNITMKAAARATSAAPTYFMEATLTETGHPPLRVIDGGVAANDPAQLALSRAYELFPDRPVFLVSIGTGEEPIPQMSIYGGLFNFAPQAINVFSNGATSAVEKGLKMELHDNYCRLQFKCDFALDDTRPTTLLALEKYAKELTLTTEYTRLMDRLVEISKMEISLK